MAHLNTVHKLSSGEKKFRRSQYFNPELLGGKARMLPQCYAVPLLLKSQKEKKKPGRIRTHYLMISSRVLCLCAATPTHVFSIKVCPNPIRWAFKRPFDDSLTLSLNWIFSATYFELNLAVSRKPKPWHLKVVSEVFVSSIKHTRELDRQQKKRPKLFFVALACHWQVLGGFDWASAHCSKQCHQ